MEYKIIGEPLPAAVCKIKAGETMITQSGGMAWMTEGINMQTSTGGIGKALGRMFSGESLFLNRYTAEKDGEIAFASKFPGSIRAIEITPNYSLIAQKSAFLAASEGVDLSIHFQKKLGAGFFGGEGFIMQKISGNGTVFLEIDGFAVEYVIKAGESMILDTGYLAAMEDTCSMEIQMIKGLKNMFFGVEGFFNTKITGPGKIIVQTMPAKSFAEGLIPFLPSGKS